MPNNNTHVFAFPICNAVYSGENLDYCIANDVHFVTLSHPMLQKHVEDKKDEKRSKQVYASVTSNSDSKDAQKIAFEKCSFAVDIFKICSNLYYNPYIRAWLFDIDHDNIKKYRQVVVSWEKSDFENTMAIEFSQRQFKTELNEDILSSVHKRHFEDFESLYKDFFGDTPTPLVKVLGKVIHMLASIFTEPNQHERVVRLCSILDTLVQDEKGSITYRLKKYIPIILENEITKRKETADFIAKMYDIRSKYVHHAEKEKVSEKEVNHLIAIVCRFIHQLISIRSRYFRQYDLYEHIDRQIQQIKINL